MKKIIPTIYAFSIDEFNDKLNKTLDLSDSFQIDIMDGAFVPESSFDLVDLKELPADKEFEIHLMVAHPLEYIHHLKRLGVKKVIFHDEIDEDTGTDIDAFKAEGFTVFLAINPITEPTKIEQYIPKIDGVLLMSVETGKSGQQFIHSTLGKVEFFRSRFPELAIEIDGGINKENIKEVFDAGVNIVAVGSAIYGAPDAKVAMDEMYNQINK